MPVGATFITKSTFSAASSVVISNCFSSTYSTYWVRGYMSISSATTATLILTGATSNYLEQRFEWGSTANFKQNTGEADTEMGTQLTTASPWQEWWINNPFEAAPTAIQTSVLSNASAIPRAFNHGYCQTDATSRTGLTITPSSGTLTGNVVIFGLRVS